MSETGRDALTKLIDAHNHLGLIVYLTQKVGHIEMFAVLQDGRVGLHKYHWELGFFGCAVELQCVARVVLTNCYYLHLSKIFALQLTGLSIEAVKH